MPLSSQTLEGCPSGMNQALPASELDDTEARYLQDVLLDQPGLIRQRGPVVGVTGAVALTRPASGIAMTLNPQGGARYGVLTGNASNGYFDVLSSDITAINASLAWPHPLPTDPSLAGESYRIVDITTALNGGALIGVSSAYDANSPNQGIAFWYGGNLADYSAPSITVARGSTAVTAPSGFNANVVPGMWLFANTDDPYTNAYIGVVRSVNSDTSITLAQGSPYAITAKAATFQSLRGLAPKVMKGAVTCDTNSTTVTGGDTKFLSQGLNTGSWNIYRASDNTWVGKVSSVQSEFALTLAANAAVAMADESYIALRADADYTIPNTANVNKVGFLNAVYAERQWYANCGAQFEKTSRVWFSDPADPEGLDLSTFDGDFIDISSVGTTSNEPIQALVSAYNALIVLKENEAFAIYGSSPSQFTVKKLEDDGVLSGMGVQPYGGGVIWPGREGIHYYDGIQVQNLLADKFGDYWKNTARTFDPSTYRMWSMVDRDHYMLFIEHISPTVSVIKGNTSSTPTRYTVVINLATRAVTLFTNVDIRGSVVLPAAAGKRIYYVVNDSSIGHICDGEALFNQEARDSITCVGSTAGPSFFWETKKFDAGDALRLKKWFMFAMHHLSQSDSLTIDLVLGLNTTGTTLSTTLPASVYTWDTLRAVPFLSWDALKTTYPTWDSVISSVFQPDRLRVGGYKDQYIAFRVYPTANAASRLRIGPYALKFKYLRPERIV